ncbi:amidohydrolase [Arthrobacter sp. NPDC089319]|uniref:amidohydrolase n=1 Tax=Arthrobacter sp. NPDC089319 TaxID=3155915 RepID=UPI003432F858
MTARTILDQLELDHAGAAKLLETYKYLHANPELSMQEYRTAKFLEEELTSLGLEVFRCGGTGVVGILRNGDGPIVGYRADTDALPVKEDSGVEYASTAVGHLEDGTEVPVMHACGHDTHMAVALATAGLLAARTEAWAGTVVFILQPGEEIAAGAKAMVADGIWDKAPRPEIVFGQHLMGSRAGTVTLVPGPAMAMADSWKVTVHGKGSHGSAPEQGIDPIVCAASMVVRLQTVVSREIGGRDTAVVTVGTFHSGLKENVIPDRAEFTLNVRTFDPAVRDKVLAALRRIITAEAAASGAPEPQIVELSSFPACYNDLEESGKALDVFREALGPENVEVGSPQMASEDVGLFAEAIGVPNVYWFLGGFTQERVESAQPLPAHHSAFFAPGDAAEMALATGVKAATAALMSKIGLGF